MRRLIIVVLIIGSSPALFAQLYNNYFFLSWNPQVPLTRDDFRNRASPLGAYIGYHQFLSDRASVGFEASIAVVDRFLPRETYYFNGGSYTTSFHNYFQLMEGTFAGTYFLSTEGKVIPFASVGMGVGIGNYRSYYNVYSDTYRKTGFLSRGMFGVLLRMHDYSPAGLRAGINVDYATTAHDELDTKNFIGAGFFLGIAFFKE